MADVFCKHCGRRIVIAPRFLRGTWVHEDSRSRFCDLGGVKFATPR